MRVDARLKISLLHRQALLVLDVFVGHIRSQGTHTPSRHTHTLIQPHTVQNKGKEYIEQTNLYNQRILLTCISLFTMCVCVVSSQMSTPASSSASASASMTDAATTVPSADKVPMTVDEMRALISKECKTRVDMAKTQVDTFLSEMRKHQIQAAQALETSWTQPCNHLNTHFFMDELKPRLPAGFKAVVSSDNYGRRTVKVSIEDA